MPADIISLASYRAAMHPDALDEVARDLALKDAVEEMMALLRRCALPLPALVAAAVASVVHVGIERTGDVDEVAEMTVTMLDGVVATRQELDAALDLQHQADGEA